MNLSLGFWAALLLITCSLPSCAQHLQTAAGSPGVSEDTGARLLSLQHSQTPKQSSNGSYTLNVYAQEVLLNCTVLDNKGQLVDGLGKSDFKVFEDKVPQTIVSLQHRDTPVSIGLLVDSSGSMKEKRDAVNKAALDLVKASNPDDETFVVDFSDQAYLDQDFTANLDVLRKSLEQFKGSGGTAIYDTVATAADKMQTTAKRPRKVLILVTDGEDNASTISLETAIRDVQGLQGPIIYSIGLLFGGDAGIGEGRRAKHALQELSDQTGGIAFFPKSLNEVDAVAAEVAQDIRNQYAVSYRSTQTADNGQYRSVRVEAYDARHKRLNVHTRLGYFARAAAR